MKIINTKLKFLAHFLYQVDVHMYNQRISITSKKTRLKQLLKSM